MAREDINFESRWVVGDGRITNPPHMFSPERDTMITNYWSGIPEKHFVKTLEEVEALFSQCTTGNADRILIEVSNIKTPNLVKVIWKNYDSAEVSTIIATNPSGNNFYVFDRSYFDVTNNQDPKEPNGMRSGREQLSNGQIITTNVIGVRIYKKKKGNKFMYGIFVNAAQKNGNSVIYISKPGAGGGEPPGSGVIIPPTI